MSQTTHKTDFEWIFWLIGGILIWNFLALKAEANVLRDQITDKNAVYVIKGARPFTAWALGDVPGTVTYDSERYKGAKWTADGRPIMEIGLEGVRLTGWFRFGVRTNEHYANGTEMEGTHQLKLGTSGYSATGYDDEHSFGLLSQNGHQFGRSPLCESLLKDEFRVPGSEAARLIREHPDWFTPSDKPAELH